MKFAKAIVLAVVFSSAAANAVGSTGNVETSSKENCNIQLQDAKLKEDAQTAYRQYAGLATKQQTNTPSKPSSTRK